MDTLRKSSPSEDRRRWEPPALKAVGTITELVGTGMGKVSLAAADSGDPPRKPKGQGPA